MPNNPTDLSIIIINYNTPKLTINCLESVYASKTGYKFEVILVDNASKDDSLDQIKNKFPQTITIKNQKNLGFGKANNQATKVASGKYLLFLNSDTILQSDTVENFLSRTISIKADISSCKLLNQDGTLQPQGGFHPDLIRIAFWMWWLDQLPIINQLYPAYQIRTPSFFSKTRQTGWVAGTAMMIKKKVFDSLNGFDEKIFMYAEDTDLCLRAQDRDYSIWYINSAVLTHLGQGSGDKIDSIIGEYQGLKYLYKTHYPAWQYPLLRLLLKSGAFLRLFVFGMIKGNEQKKDIYLKCIKVA